MSKIELPPLRVPGLFEKTSTDPFIMDKIHDIPLNRLVPFKTHPFKLYEGEKLNDLVESIKSNGVMIPIIVRPVLARVDESVQYEILSGHNRVEAARVVGLEIIPAIVRDCSDSEAMLVVTTTNLIQRQFGEMAHSERAYVLASYHSAIKMQGQRTDLMNEIENMFKASNDGKNQTSSPMGNKLTSMGRAGQEYALSKNTVARYLRVNMLIDPLKECLDGGEFGIRVAVALSYLKEEAQRHVADVITTTSYKLDMKKADELKTKQPTSREAVEQIISGQKDKGPASFMLKSKLVTKYFASNASRKEIESTLIAALDMYFTAQRKEK